MVDKGEREKSRSRKPVYYVCTKLLRRWSLLSVVPVNGTLQFSVAPTLKTRKLFRTSAGVSGGPVAVACDDVVHSLLLLLPPPLFSLINPRPIVEWTILFEFSPLLAKIQSPRGRASRRVTDHCAISRCSSFLSTTAPPSPFAGNAL